MSSLPSDPTPASRVPLRTILAPWRPHAPRLLAGVLLSLAAFAVGLALLGTAGMRLAGTGVGLLLLPVLALRLLGVGRVLGRYVERMFTHDAMFRVLADLRLWFFRRLAAGAAGGIGFRRSGDLLSRLVADVEALDGLYLRILLPAAAAVVALPVLLILAGRHDGALAIVLGAVFVLSAVVLPLTAAAMAARDTATLSGRAAALRVATLDLVSGLREIRAFDAGNAISRRLRDSEGALLSVQHLLARRGAAAGAGALLCQQLALLVTLMALAGMAFAPFPPIPGVLLLFVLLAAFESVAGLPRAGTLLGHVGAAARRLVEADTAPINRAPFRDPVVSPPAVPAGHALRVRDLGFRWQPDRPPVFEHLSLDIPAGARVAILGASGAGKSTLVLLLLRVLTPDSGSIILGGVPLSALAPDASRAAIGWLGQDTHLFADTIRANLLLGRPDATDAALWQVLDQAQLSSTIRALPDSLDHWLGEGGSGLSGGQRRRLALARVLLSPAPILVLDEPAAGLDADTERDLLQTLNALDGDRTLILIVHRLFGVERLDRVWRLADGRAAPAPT